MTGPKKIAPRFPSDDGQMFLPFWSEQNRGIPWAAIRSALFAPVRPGTRKSLTRETLASLESFKVVYTGFQLDQADLDVFAQVMHEARQQPLGQVVEFRTRDMLRNLGRSTGKSDREWLLASLSRLQACAIEFQGPPKDGQRVIYSGSLLMEQGRIEAINGTQGTHYVKLNPKLRDLYAPGWSSVGWEARKSLGKNQLAKWLHSFCYEQQRPLTFKIEKLMAMSNSNYARERDFRNALDDAALALRPLGITVRLDWDVRAGNVTLSASKTAAIAPQRG
ncbi:plasmid replication initiator TrfA [Xanthomonas campestris]|uniref:plasmid replication initiator TrfA n=1 Tax=Xanthomonas campestris TaxID=339 RepID=UPI002B2365B0|nr:plasmid replication initiator TrfA [Xanthomonas campestris]MEA9776920.1 plasmid replication initiator TrfA [Xanthomonas campestris pv. raphani]